MQLKSNNKLTASRSENASVCTYACMHAHALAPVAPEAKLDWYGGDIVESSFHLREKSQNKQSACTRGRVYWEGKTVLRSSVGSMAVPRLLNDIPVLWGLHVVYSVTLLRSKSHRWGLKFGTHTCIPCHACQSNKSVFCNLWFCLVFVRIDMRTYKT